MLTYNLKENKYITLYAKIRDDILRGKIESGERLPSKRAFAAELGVSVVTVQLAYDQLLAEGYIYSKERSGYFVEKVEKTDLSEPPPVVEMPIERKKYALDLVDGSTPNELFPFTVWAKLMRAVLSDCGENLLSRPDLDGDSELKRAIAKYIYRARGIEVNPRYIVVGSGAEHLYGVIVQLLGRELEYAVENPSFKTISSVYSLNGARTIPVEVGLSGMSAEKLANTSAAVWHLSPSHQFPTGAVMPASARHAIINLARERGAYIIEDDYDSEFRLSGKPLKSMLSLSPDRVIYVNTFSKTLAPSLRMGYMVLPPELYERYLKLFKDSACQVPLFEQKTLAAMLDKGFFERHIQTLKNHYRTVRAYVLEQIAALGERTEIFNSDSGLHLVVRFLDRTDGEIKSYADSNSIRIKCLDDYLIAPTSENFDGCAVINYAGLGMKK